MIRSIRRKVPVFMLLEAAMIAREHWGLLQPHERSELGRIIRKSGGRPGNLSERERSELRRLVGRLDLVTAGRRMLPLNGGVRKSRFPGRNR